MFKIKKKDLENVIVGRDNYIASNIIEAIPNVCFSNKYIIDTIVSKINRTTTAKVINIDSSISIDRTVFTILGNIEEVFKAIDILFQITLENVDMTFYKSQHPRIGAIDVCPFVALDKRFEEELIIKVNKFASYISKNFSLPIYLYEKSQKNTEKKQLAIIRKGMYENIYSKMTQDLWIPDFMPSINLLDKKNGATVMGVRDFLIAFNVNFKTSKIELLKDICKQIRENSNTNILNKIKGLRAIAWSIYEFNISQISMNLTDTNKIDIYTLYKILKKYSVQYDLNISGSELIGMIPDLYWQKAYKSFLVDFPLDNEENFIDFIGINSVKPFNIYDNVLKISKFQ